MRDIIQCVQNDNKNVNVKDTILAIKKAGFDGVFIQWYNKAWDFTQQEQLDMCRSLGLKIPFVHLGYKGINNLWLDNIDGRNLMTSYKNDLKICSQNNIDMVVMHLTSKNVAPEPNVIGLNRLKELAEYGKELNIKIAFENTKIFGYLEYVIDNLKTDNVGICLDTGHCHCHFDDRFSWPKFKNKIFAVHFHDNDKSDDLHLLPFDGDINWKEYVKNLKDAKYKNDVTLESCYRYDYLNISLEDFYKESYIRGLKIREMFNEN